MRYFLVENGEIVEGPTALPNAWRNVSGLHLASAEFLKSRGWLPQVKVGDDAAFDPATHKLTGPVNTIGTDDVTSTWTVVQMTTQEQTARQKSLDTAALLDGLLDLAEIVITHIDAHLTKGTLVATDFAVATRQKYLALKARVDRLR